MKITRKVMLILAMLLSLTTLAAPTSAQSEVIDLGTLGGDFAQANAINNRSQVVGVSTTTAGEHHAFLWEKGLMTDLGTLGGTGSLANDINDHGQVVGISSTAAGKSHAFLWEKGVMTDLGTPLGYDVCVAKAINNRSQVVGYCSDTAFLKPIHALLWENGVMTDLGTLDGIGNSYAYDINDHGQVVGASSTADGKSHAFLWERGAMIDLGTLGGNLAVANAINNLGQVVGGSYTAAGDHLAFFWKGGIMTALPTLGYNYSNAYDINDLEQVVGFSDDLEYTSLASLWENGDITNLGTLLPNGQSFALSINSKGQVTIDGYTASGQQHAFLWRKSLPTPAPEQQVTAIIEQVNDLVAAGSLNQGQGTALQSKLDSVLRHLNMENDAAACSLLVAFSNHVQALGSLTGEEKQSLIDAANVARSQLCP
jgi:probable HAF family extracellular repeat protein